MTYYKSTWHEIWAASGQWWGHSTAEMASAPRVFRDRTTTIQSAVPTKKTLVEKPSPVTQKKGVGIKPPPVTEKKAAGAKTSPVTRLLRHSRIQTTLHLYTQGDGDETRAAQGAFLREMGLATETIQ